MATAELLNAGLSSLRGHVVVHLQDLRSAATTEDIHGLI